MAEGLPNVQPNGAVEYLSPHGDLQSNVRCSVRRPDTTAVIVEPNPLRSSLLPTVLSLRRSAKLGAAGRTQRGRAFKIFSEKQDFQRLQCTDTTKPVLV